MSAPEDAKAEDYEHKDEHKDEPGSCPCLFVKPCHEDCTCVRPFMSRGCERCCNYGSLEQRTAMARRLVKLHDFDRSCPAHEDLRDLCSELDEELEELKAFLNKSMAAEDRYKKDLIDLYVETFGYPREQAEQKIDALRDKNEP